MALFDDVHHGHLDRAVADVKRLYGSHNFDADERAYAANSHRDITATCLTDADCPAAHSDNTTARVFGDADRAAANDQRGADSGCIHANTARRRALHLPGYFSG